ncbi:dihydrodipicolinate reductase [Natroniella sp. ANB-PHB2]|uniref:NAD(P)H-dependent amine dehydrogenase family protein n=1 Tax=Natroniella sp. ANB-PHB2 TaxID=3384444 RepID=UPI0038D47BB0
MEFQSDVKVILCGCGMTGEYFIRYLHQRGAEIVGAIDNNSDLVGKDIGFVAGLDNPLGVTISDDPIEVFDSSEANVCIISVASFMKDVYPFYKLAASEGINAISISEEAVYPWNTSPKLSEELDQLAKENDCTLTTSGYQDMLCCNMVTSAAGAAYDIEKITGVVTGNLGNYGVELADLHGLGLSVESFKEKIVPIYTFPSFMWNINEWICAKLNWTVESIDQRVEPIVYQEDIYHKKIDRFIPSGNVVGLSAIVIVITTEGPVVESQCDLKVFVEGEVDVSKWTIHGEPEIDLEVSAMALPVTCASTINRIPQILKAPAGFYTTDKLPIDLFNI